MMHAKASEVGDQLVDTTGEAQARLVGRNAAHELQGQGDFSGVLDGAAGSQQGEQRSHAVLAHRVEIGGIAGDVGQDLDGDQLGVGLGQ